MSYNLCDECIEKTGPFKLSEYQSENNAYCHGCHQGRPTKSVAGLRETCTNVRRCRGQTPIFPPEKYDEYTTGWSELRSEPYDPDFPIPPIWIHCPACRAEEKTAEQVLDVLNYEDLPGQIPKLHHLGKPTPGDPFVEGMLQHVHDLPLPPALKPEEGDYAELVNEEDEQGQVRICRKDGTVAMLMSRADYDAVMNYAELKPGKKET